MTKTRTGHSQTLLEINSVALDLLKLQCTKMMKTRTGNSQMLLEIKSVALDLLGLMYENAENAYRLLSFEEV